MCYHIGDGLFFNDFFGVVYSMTGWGYDGVACWYGYWKGIQTVPARTVEGDLSVWTEFWMGRWYGAGAYARSHSHPLHGDWQGSRGITLSAK